MAKHDNSITIILIVLFGVLVQILFYIADSEDTPHKAVVEFSKAYFQLDPSMSDRLSSELITAEGVDVVDRYIVNVAKEAKDQGFGINFMKSKLYHITTHTVNKGDSQAQIRITGIRRTAINPLYAVVAQIFNIGETCSVDETINVVLEDDKWKVCGKVFSL